MRLLLLSNSTQRGRGMLEHAAPAIGDFLDGIERILFVPFALKDHDAYAARAFEAFAGMGVRLESAHAVDDPAAAIGDATAVFVGGGNTFRLLREMRTRRLLDPLRERALAGMPYIGSSAGTNLACPTIRTTNDMPVVDSKGLGALDLIPFQVNCHYLDADPDSSHMGETREQRIREYLEENNKVVVGLRESTWLRREGDRLELFGLRPARIFRRDADPEERKSPADLSDLLD